VPGAGAVSPYPSVCTFDQARFCRLGLSALFGLPPCLLLVAFADRLISCCSRPPLDFTFGSNASLFFLLSKPISYHLLPWTPCGN
jgi:hypothetical protein